MNKIRFEKILLKFTVKLLLLFAFFVNLNQVSFSQQNSNSNNSEKNLSQLEKNPDSLLNPPNDKEKKTTDQLNPLRVISNKTVELVEDDACECAFVAISPKGFPFYYLYALGGASFIPVVINQFDDKIPTGPTEVVSPSAP